MPVHETKGGYKYGETGKTYKDKKSAIKQAIAIAYSKAREKGRKPTQREITAEIKGSPDELAKTASATRRLLRPLAKIAADPFNPVADALAYYDARGKTSVSPEGVGVSRNVGAKPGELGAAKRQDPGVVTSQVWGPALNLGAHAADLGGKFITFPYDLVQAIPGVNRVLPRATNPGELALPYTQHMLRMGYSPQAAANIDAWNQGATAGAGAAIGAKGMWDMSKVHNNLKDESFPHLVQHCSHCQDMFYGPLLHTDTGYPSVHLVL